MFLYLALSTMAFGVFVTNMVLREITERKLPYWAEQTEVQAKVATAWALRADLELMKQTCDPAPNSTTDLWIGDLVWLRWRTKSEMPPL